MSEAEPQKYNITCRVEGIELIGQRLFAVNSQLKRRTAEVMQRHMNEAVAESQVETAARGWRLSETIRVSVIDAENLIVEGGCYAWYAGFPEFGTIKQNAQPFWRPFVWNHFFEMLRELGALQRELYGR